MRILLIEDDESLVHLLRRSLTEQGYAVDIAYSGEEGEGMARSIPYDLLILDIMLPRKDGLAVCASLRQDNIKTRILMLTAKTDTNDKVKCLDSGADDYLTKPYDLAELTARIRALLRRDVVRASPVLQAGDVSLNTVKREVKRGDRIVALTNKEFSILEYLIANPDAVVSHRMIEDHCWNDSLDSSSNLIEAYIQRLRKKLDIPGQESIIETIRGAGYRLKSW